MTSLRLLIFGTTILGSVVIGAAAARADIFLLHNDGQVRGELLNKDESPRQSYVVRTPGGGQLTLEATQVKQQVTQSPEAMSYDRFRLKAPDTVEGQWKMAEWCREKELLQQRKVHLERIIELDPDHAPARRALGYSHVHGQWATPKEAMTKSGYVMYKGSWRLPQEIAIVEGHHKEDLAQKDWFRKIKMWSEWLDSNKDQQARANIIAIDDPYAAKALATYLGKERDRDIKYLYIDALSHVGTPGAMDALVHASLYDADDEVRITCLERIVQKKYKPAVGAYIQGLRSKDNVLINRAGVGLSHMQDPVSIAPLIDALVTTHKFQIQRGQPGQTTSTFGTGANSGQMPGMSFGTPPVEIVKQTFNNQDVLSALLSLTTPVNFEFDTHAWKYWYASQKKPATMDARRD